MSSATDTPIMISIILFYGLLAISIPFINAEFDQNAPEITWDSAFDIVASYTSLVAYSIVGMPLWLSILFSFPAIFLVYLIARFVRGI